MRWFRSLAAELFPSWHERRLLKQSKAADAKRGKLVSLQRALRSANTVETNRAQTSERRPSGRD